MKKSNIKVVTDEKSRLEKIELAKFEFAVKQANGPVPITPMDVAKLMGMEDDYREALFEEELKRNFEEIMRDITETDKNID